MTNETQIIPPDDVQRKLALARPNEDQSLPHIGLVGDTYTILLTGEDTAGRYCLIDMLVPPGGGPPPHRHDFEEMFSVIEGEIEVTFRGAKSLLRAGETANIPAMRRTNSTTSHSVQHGCSAYARQPDKKSSSWLSALLFRAGRRHLQSSTGPPKRR